MLWGIKYKILNIKITSSECSDKDASNFLQTLKHCNAYEKQSCASTNHRRWVENSCEIKQKAKHVLYFFYEKNETHFSGVFSRGGHFREMLRNSK